MADIATPQPPLGISRLIGESFSLYFNRFLVLTGLALLPAIVQVIVPVFALGSATFAPPGAMPPESYFVGLTITVAISIIATVVAAGAVTLAAYDAKLGRPPRVGFYVSRTLGALVPLVVLGLVLYILVTLGFILLIVPALYVMGRYWVFAPAILVERVGFAGLGRAATLSARYRWSIVGAILGMMILLFLLSLVFSLVTAAMVGVAAETVGGLAATPALLLQVVIGAVQLAIFSTFTALLYARLREVKEGTRMDDLVTVFA